MKSLFCFSNPPLNPVTKKAQKLPLFNPLDPHGRVFFFAWASFCCSFAAWYSFSPLAKTIRADMKFTNEQWLNSNIVALLAGMVMRFAVGPIADTIGPRKTMTLVLLLAAVPAGLAGLIKNYTGLLLIRFFVGIAGATFVPCVAWCTLFYDKNVVGTANGFAAGWGNAGAGLSYFFMPAAYDSLRHHFGYSSHTAWRISFIIPCILLLFCAAGVFFLCPDTPTGPWKDRFVNTSEIVMEESGTITPPSPSIETESKNEKGPKVSEVAISTLEAGESSSEIKFEKAKKPTLKEAASTVFTLQTLMLAAPYACSFGGELAVNSILGPWYLQHFPKWGQTKAGQVAAAFGLFNVVSRPLGGFLADYIYSRVPARYGVKSKQIWYGFLVFMQGVFLLWIGLVNPKSPGVLVTGIQLMALWMDQANGAAYSLVPHVNPEYNGIMSGIVGSTGNLGGVIWSVVYRFTNYHKGTWIVGVGSIVIGAAMTLIPPISKKQLAAGGYMSR